MAVETWHEVVKAVTQTTRSAFPSSPPFDAANPAPFRAYWHGVFTRLHAEVLSDPEIPEKLTSPPTDTFTITLFRGSIGCPCCLPHVEPNISLRNAEGVTKGDFVRGLMEGLYGPDREHPLIHNEWEHGIDDDDDDDGEDEDSEAVAPKQEGGPLVYDANWMSSPRRDGVRYVYGDNIWMYCCRWDEFARNSGGNITESETPSQSEPKAQL